MTGWSKDEFAALGGGGRLLGVLFGDRVGLVLAIAAALFYLGTMRITFFINDSHTFGNALVAVADGHLYLDGLPYDWGPGLHTVDGRTYGRNYGQVLFALPFLWVLQALSLVVDLRVALVGAWSLLLLAFVDQVGAVVGRREQFGLFGAVAALAGFGVNLVTAYPVTGRTLPIIALQLAAMTAAVGIVVVVYRLVSDIHGRGAGAAAGTAVAVASPVAFWSTFPKRHSFTALLTVLVVYTFYRSRVADGPRTSLRFRGLAYGVVAVAATIHAPEAFVLLVALGVVDVATARSNAVREMLAVGVCFGVALLPFLVINAAISGNPLRPPRMLPSYSPGGSPSDGLIGGRGAGGSGSDAVFLVAVLDLGVYVITSFFDQLLRSLRTMTDTERLYHVFVRSGYLEGVASQSGGLAVRLSMLESMPLLGGLVALPLVGYRRAQWAMAERRFDPDPAVATDALVLAITALFVLVYWPRLPIHAAITVRYLHPVYPLGVYLLARVPAVRRTLDSRGSLLAWVYCGFVLVGGQLFVVVLATLPRTFSEAYQLSAIASAVAGVAVAVWAVVATLRQGFERSGAVVLALAAAAATTFLLLSAFVYYDTAPDYVLPAARAVAEAVDFV